MSKKLEDYDIVEILNGYDSETDGLANDDEIGNELDAQAKNDNIILICMKSNTYSYQFVPIDTFPIEELQH